MQCTAILRGLPPDRPRCLWASYSGRLKPVSTFQRLLMSKRRCSFGVKFVATKHFGPTPMPSLTENLASWEMVPSSVHKRSTLSDTPLPAKKKGTVLFGPERVTGISIWPNWVAALIATTCFTFPICDRWWYTIRIYQVYSFFLCFIEALWARTRLFSQAHCAVHPSAFPVWNGT